MKSCENCKWYYLETCCNESSENLGNVMFKSEICEVWEGDLTTNMNIKLHSENARVPERSFPTDAGADLFSPIDLKLFPNSHKFVDLEISIELPQNTVGLIFARSGLGSKNGVRPRNCVGVIDEKYRGTLGIMLENASYDFYDIKKGDKIAQLVVMPVFTPTFTVVDELSETDRGVGGFGSTGRG